MLLTHGIAICSDLKSLDTLNPNPAAKAPTSDYIILVNYDYHYQKEYC